MEKIRSYFRTAMRCFINSISLLLIIILFCCFPTTHKVLSVPYFSQIYLGWCGAACIQMWSYYDGYSPTQQEIASYIGWTGAHPAAIAQGVGIFTNSIGVDMPFGSSEVQQDLAIAAQTASIDDNIPSVSIIDQGYHAGIVIGWDWTPTIWGPRADQLRYHDPQRGGNIWRTVRQWKDNYFTAYQGQHVIILGLASHVGEGEAGYWEFLAAGGCYYGGPKDYEPMD